MTNVYQTAQNLGLVGTDQQIVDQLKATGVTARPIRLDELLFLLNTRGMLIRLIRPADTGEKWAGTVVNMVLYLNASGTPDQAAAVNQWFSHITNDRNNLFDTTQAAFASSFWALAQSFGGQPGFPSTDDFTAVADLGGGWLFDDLTVEQYNADKGTYEQQQAARSTLQAIQIRRQAWDMLAAEIRSGIESGQFVDNAAVLAALTEAL